MKKIKYKKRIRALVFLAIIALNLFIAFLISINFIVDPIIYWLASTQKARMLIALILAWFLVSICFDSFYKHYKRRKKIERFNALHVPYARTFRGRK